MSGPAPAELFLQEAQDLLEQLEQALLDLAAQQGTDQRSGGSPRTGDLIDTAFRALHTIKGSGAMFGFEAVAGFTHHVETVFDRLRQGRLHPGPAVISLALAAKDHIRKMIDQPGPDDDAAAAPILAGLAALLEADTAAPASPASPAPTAGPAPGWRLLIRLPLDAMQMGTNPLLLLDELRTLGSATVVAQLDDLPPLDAIDPTSCHVWWRVDLVTDQPKRAIEDVFLFVMDDMTLQIEALAGEAHAGEAHAGEPNAGEAPGGEAMAPEAAGARAATSGPAQTPPGAAGAPPPDQPTPRPAAAKLAAVATGAAADAAGPEPAGRRMSDSVRVPAERLDDLMDRVGELVIAQSRLSQVAANSRDPQVKSVAEDIERLTMELRDSTMGVRTVPIGSLFGRFRRLVHDLSAQLGKEIALVTVGEATELDKTVVEKLNDPLIHLLRNSLDHGLEGPQGRADAGKPPVGRITLSARHAGADVLISIADDGRGLDRERIRARAEENGLLAPGSTPPDAELFQLIFQPGFSTAPAVTSLSGRGVGMDVVKRAIEALRGKIEVASIAGRGTELTLRLPLTLAIIDGLLVRVGSGRYVLPLSSVEECVELTPAQDAGARGRNFLNIRDALVPFLRLREMFSASSPPDPYQKVVVVSAGSRHVGLVVDQVIGNHQTVIKSLPALHDKEKLFSGATILADGAVALILDVAHLVDFGQARDERRRAG